MLFHVCDMLPGQIFSLCDLNLLLLMELVFPDYSVLHRFLVGDSLEPVGVGIHSLHVGGQTRLWHHTLWLSFHLNK